jgi:hypothetical protein
MSRAALSAGAGGAAHGANLEHGHGAAVVCDEP